jgi:hypothetical protein
MTPEEATRDTPINLTINVLQDKKSGNRFPSRYALMSGIPPPPPARDMERTKETYDSYNSV